MKNHDKYEASNCRYFMMEYITSGQTFERER